MPRPEQHIEQQRILFEKFRSKSIHIRHWSKNLMTHHEMQRLYGVLADQHNLITSIAMSDNGESGISARKFLGL